MSGQHFSEDSITVTENSQTPPAAENHAQREETGTSASVANFQDNSQANHVDRAAALQAQRSKAEGLVLAFKGLAIAEQPSLSLRGRGRGIRPTYNASHGYGHAGPPGPWNQLMPSQLGDPYAAMRMHSGQMHMQWVPYPPAMGYSMYGEPRQGLYYDARMPGHPGYPPAFYPTPHMPQPMQGTAQGPRFPGPNMQGYYVQPPSQAPVARQRPQRPSKASQQASESFDFEIGEAERNPGTCRKTLMLRNIPNKYSIHMLLEMLDSCHRKGPNELVYDFCYLPIDFKNRCNLGYAFVNFVDADSTIQCYKAFHEKRWNDFNSKKVCEVKYGRVQGREALIEHFRNSKFPSNDTDSLPLLFEQLISESGEKSVQSVPLHSKQPS